MLLLLRICDLACARQNAEPGVSLPPLTPQSVSDRYTQCHAATDEAAEAAAGTVPSAAATAAAAAPEVRRC